MVRDVHHVLYIEGIGDISLSLSSDPERFGSQGGSCSLSSCSEEVSDCYSSSTAVIITSKVLCS